MTIHQIIDLVFLAIIKTNLSVSKTLSTPNFICYKAHTLVTKLIIAYKI